jgi:hypothetical protein
VRSPRITRSSTRRQVGAADAEVTYRDYGSTPTPQKPSAGAQQKAPPIVYQMLNG